MRLWFKPDRLQAYGLSTNDIQNALLTQSVELPAGKIAGNTTELSVRTFGKLNTEEQFKNLIIKNIDGVNVKLSDVADVVLGPEDEESGLKESGVPMIMLAIIPQPGSNYVSISDENDKRLRKIKNDLPKDIKMDVGMDQTEFIKKSISEVEETLIIALILVIIMMYLFFLFWILALSALFDFTVSLIGAFFFMYLFGFTHQCIDVTWNCLPATACGG